MPVHYRTTDILAIIPVLLLCFQPCANAAYTLEQQDKFIKEIYAKTIPDHKKTWSKIIERPVKDFLIEQGMEFCDSLKGAMTVEQSQELQRDMDAISQKYSQGKGSTENIKIVVTNALHYVDNYIIGSVTNVGNKTATFVRVNFAVFDAAGVMVDIGSTNTIPLILKPRQTGLLKTATLKKGQTVRTTSVEWMNSK